MLSPTWANDFEVPWSKVPQRDLLSQLEKGMRPSPKVRREMIRIVCGDIANITLKPGKKTLACIAQEMVNRYPKSFKDNVEGIIVGTGYDRVLRQLIHRFENINRNSNVTPKKHKREEDGNENSESNKKVITHDSYGCINYLPNNYQSGDSEATQQETKSLLKEKYLCSALEEVEVETFMKECYILQRKEIVPNGKSMLTLRTEWPFLFQPDGMNVHSLQ